MKITIDITGNRYGRWFVVSYHGIVNRQQYFSCLCDCGSKKLVARASLESGRSLSCGCLHMEILLKCNVTHGHTAKNGYSKEYRSWCSMKARCSNKKHKHYADYGGRGITFCDEWKSFERFLKDMGTRHLGYSLERKNNTLGYSKDNCIWATRSDQANNRRNNHVVSFQGGNFTIMQLSRKTGIKYQRLLDRITTLGWSVDKAVSCG